MIMKIKPDKYVVLVTPEIKETVYQASVEIAGLIDDHIWEPFEDLEPSFIWDQILNLAKSMREYIDQT